MILAPRKKTDAPSEGAVPETPVEAPVKKPARKKAAPAAEVAVEDKPKRTRKKAEAAPEPEVVPPEVAPEEKPKRTRAKKAEPVAETVAAEPEAAPAAKPKRVRLRKAEPAPSEAVLITVDMDTERKKPKARAKKKPAAASDASRALLDLVVKTLDDNKAEEILSIDLAGKSSIADFMVIANGRSGRQVTALADYVVKAVDEAKLGPCRTEGKSAGDWVLIDAGDVIVHLFRPEVREFYKLEKMWQPDFRPDGE